MPPKRRPQELGSPQRIYDNSGEELIEQTEAGRLLVTILFFVVLFEANRAQQEKREAAKKKKSKSNGTLAVRTGSKSGTSSRYALSQAESGLGSGDESDGQSAIRSVEEKEKGKGARRGPGNASMQHFKDPVPVQDKSGQKRWEFRCQYCST